MKAFLLRVRDLVTGPRDDDGKIRPARPAIIIGVTVVILVVLTWLTRGWIWFAVAFVALYWWLIVEGRKQTAQTKKEEKIRAAFGGVQVMSTFDIARNTGLDVAEVEALLPKMITTATTGRKSRDASERILRNARFDVTTHKVTLDPRAADTVMQRIGAGANAVLDRFAPAKPAAPKPDWRCDYCRTTNSGDADVCVKCRAGRPA